MTTNNLRTALAALSIAFGSTAVWAEPASYADPNQAVEAFVTALKAQDKAALLEVFGPESEDLMASGDSARDAEARTEFLRGYEVFHALYDLDEGKKELVIGRTRWSFPVPLVQVEGGWQFDSAAARDEIQARRIGLNELDVIDILRRYPQGQAAFRNIDYDGDGVMEYASSILSTPGQRDGLYWPHEDGTADSPLGEKIAQAAADGVSIDGVDQEPVPYLGYYYRILTSQGDAAPGGAYDYLVNGNMVAGHALLAYPADPGNSGVMSFIVGENGVIYESDLGDDTLVVAGGITTFDPGDGWTVVEE